MMFLSHARLRLSCVLSICLLTLSLSACNDRSDSAQTQTTAPQPVIKTSDNQAQVATNALRDLADDIWASYVENSTYLRLQEGLPIEEFEDLTLAQYHADQARTAEFRGQLEQIDAEQLTGDDLITYEILALQLEDNGANDDDYWLSFDITAYQAPYTVQFAKQALASQQFPDPAAAQHYLVLVSELADIIDQLKLKLDGQVERGIYLPKPALPSTRATWQGIGSLLPLELVPADERLSALAPEQQAEFKAELDALIASRIVGGFERLLAAMGDAYEAQAPETVGLGQYPGGLDVYKRKIRIETTLNLTSVEIHDRGPDAVADISARMAAIRNELGFKGTSEEFLVKIQADPAYIAESPEEVEDRFMQYIHRSAPQIRTEIFQP